MISYTVCAYCFENLEVGTCCDCLLSQGQPPKTTVRYTELFEGDVKNYAQDILGEVGWENEDRELTVSGSLVGAQILLLLDIELCKSCQEKCQKACEEIAEIINNCGEKK